MWQVSHAVSCAGRACDCYVGRLRAALAVSTEGVGKQVSEVIDNTLWFIPDSHIWHEDRDCPSLRNTFRMNATRAEVENGHPRCGKPKTEGCARCSDWGFDRVSKEESK